MKYLPLLNLYLTHTYYTDQRCADFQIEPTPATQRLLNNMRGRLKLLPNGLQILVALDNDGTTFIPLQPGMTFSFQLRLQNASFALFTDLAEFAGLSAPIYANTENKAGNPAELKLAERQAWSTEHFVVRQTSKQESFILSGHPLIGIQSDQWTLVGLGQVTHPPSYDKATNTITIDSSAAKTGDMFSITYATAPKRANGVFADVEITYRDAPPSIASNPDVFQINFKAKIARWIYYVVSDSSSTKFTVKDADTSTSLDNEINDNQIDPSDTVATMLAQQYPKMYLFRFTSHTLLPCQQTARKSFQLFVDKNSAISVLPNPALHNYTIHMKPNTQPGEYALFCVVPFFTKLISTSGG